jgi:hypothetical protein
VPRRCDLRSRRPTRRCRRSRLLRRPLATSDLPRLPTPRPDDPILGRHPRLDCEAYQPIEEQPAPPRLAPVEAEDELVEVGVEVLLGDAALVRAE